jgi:tetratricopeptide (TPR) repeat protein
MSESSRNGSVSEADGEPGAQALEARIGDAVTLHQAGQVDRAQGLYEGLLREWPEHPDVLHLLGLVAHQQGRNEDARRLIGDAIKVRDDQPFYHNNLGEVLRVLGDMRGAADCYRSALSLDMDYGQAHNNLGMVMYQMGEFAAAVEAFQGALRIHADSAEVFNNLGVAQQAAGDPDGATSSFRRALELDPRNLEACNNLGAALHERGDLEEAEQRLSQAIELDPDCDRAYFTLACLLADRGDLEGALQASRTAIRLDAGQADFHVNHASLLRRQGDLNGSLESLRAAIAVDPRHAVAHNDLGVDLLVLGRFDEAVSSFRRALQLNPRLANAYENLAKARRFGPEDRQQADSLEALAATPGLAHQARVHVHFALGKMLDDLAEHERAFAHFKTANELKHSTLSFDRAACASFVERTCASIDAALVEDKRGLGNPSQKPVFIVGMPRSGTTLVEQILASHPLVHATGEREYFRRVSAGLGGELAGSADYPECLRDLDGAAMDRISRAYLEETIADAGEAERVTDKMPLNFEHLGLIALTFPDAGIIHCRRDPVDLCLSIYFQHFAGDNAFAYSVEDIAEYHRQYQRLMSHWHRVLPGRIHDVHYEELVANLEQVSRGMLERIGLAFDESCLQFHRTERPVGTSSHWQVRQPLYTRSVERWRNYEPHIKAFRAALEHGPGR